MKTKAKATYRNDQGRTIRPNAVEMTAIRGCSGYTGNGVYLITSSTKGETRLYKFVGDVPMDACLRDVPDLAKAAMRNRI